MLVLSRQREEKIMIGDDVEITVLDVYEYDVRLCVTAPISLRVCQEESQDLVSENNFEITHIIYRKRDEMIMIGDDIEIRIVDIRGDKVRLGITAPNMIPVHRKEVWDAVQRENAEQRREAEKYHKLHLSNGSPSRGFRPPPPPTNDPRSLSQPDLPTQPPTPPFPHPQPKQT